jgi:flavin reductase (DIM6/NTAB) family NADH-FMN oxidoreductase RutF
MFAANQTQTNTRKESRKDTVVNVESTGSFVWNVCTWDLREAMNITSEHFPHSTDEFTKAGLAKIPSTTLKHEVSMVSESPIKFECTYFSTLRLPGNPPLGSVSVIIGRVVGIHIDDRVLTDGMVDLRKIMPVARCGYHEYAVVRETFVMMPPGGGVLALGMEGSTAGNAKEWDRMNREKKSEELE